MKCFSCSADIETDAIIQKCPSCGATIIKSTNQENNIVDILKALYVFEGKDILLNSGQLLAYISDIAPSMKSEQQRIKVCAEIGILQSFYSLYQEQDLDRTEFIKASKKLQDKRFFDEKKADETVSWFAEMLGYPPMPTIMEMETENQQNEAEQVYTQLIDTLENILENKNRIEATQLQLNAAKQEAKHNRDAINYSLQAKLQKYERDKDILMRKTKNLAELREKLQELKFEQHRVDDENSSSKKQLTSLGIFSFSKKKELNQKINQLTSESSEIANEIDILQNEINTLSAAIEQLGTISEIETQIDAVSKEAANKLHTADKEANTAIAKIEAKLEELQNNGTLKSVLSKIEKEISNKNNILEYIKKIIKSSKSLKIFLTYPLKSGSCLGCLYYLEYILKINQIREYQLNGHFLTKKTGKL